MYNSIRNINMETIKFYNLETKENESITSLCQGNYLVIDFWHTKCTKCPLALEKLNDMTKDYPNVNFASCALSLVEDDIDIISDLVEDSWDNLKKLYLTINDKEKAKEIFGFKAVPYCLIFSPSGELVASNDPKEIDFESVFNSFQTTDDF